MPTEYGSPIYAGHRPKADASLVALIRRAGGTLIGKTVTTEFAHLDPGKTRNPLNLAHTPGGSSSGSAAGVAAGFFPIATGSQTGGSVIRPASYLRRRGLQAVVPAAADRRHEMRVLASRHRGPVRRVGRRRGLRRRRHHRPRSARRRHDPGVAAHRRAARAALAGGQRRHDGGARHRRARGLGRRRPRARHQLPPVLADAFRAHATIQAYEAARALASEYERHRDQLAKGVRELVEGGLAITRRRL